MQITRRKALTASAAAAVASALPASRATMAGGSQGPNDQRLWRLDAEHRYWNELHDSLDGDDDDGREAAAQRETSVIRQMAGIEPDSLSGAVAMIATLDRDWIPGQPFAEHMEFEPKAEMAQTVFAMVRRLAGEV